MSKHKLDYFRADRFVLYFAAVFLALAIAKGCVWKAKARKAESMLRVVESERDKKSAEALTARATISRLERRMDVLTVAAAQEKEKYDQAAAAMKQTVADLVEVAQTLATHVMEYDRILLDEPIVEIIERVAPAAETLPDVLVAPSSSLQPP